MSDACHAGTSSKPGRSHQHVLLSARDVVRTAFKSDLILRGQDRTRQLAVHHGRPGERLVRVFQACCHAGGTGMHAGAATGGEAPAWRACLHARYAAPDAAHWFFSATHRPLHPSSHRVMLCQTRPPPTQPVAGGPQAANTAPFSVGDIYSVAAVMLVLGLSPQAEQGHGGGARAAAATPEQASARSRVPVCACVPAAEACCMCTRFITNLTAAGALQQVDAPPPQDIERGHAQVCGR